MQTIPRSSFVRSSHRVTLRAKYLAPTNHRGTRIVVSRYESDVYGKDTNKTTVSWDYALDNHDNYEKAVLEYLRRANWGGHWVVSTITDGAVAVCAGEYVA